MLDKTKKENLDDRLPTLSERVVVKAPRFKTISFKLVGLSPYVSNNFSKEAQDMMAEKQKQGSQAKKGSKRAPKDFEADYRRSMHVSTEGWYGHPASSFRQAMVDACRTVGYKMNLAKLAVSIIEDGYDADSGVPLVRIEGKPKRVDSYVRLANGAPDIKARGHWDKWSMNLKVEFDQDMFSSDDIVNLLLRVGRQVGIGAGRPYSKTSCGQGWGKFTLAGGVERSKA